MQYFNEDIRDMYDALNKDTQINVAYNKKKKNTEWIHRNKRRL